MPNRIKQAGPRKGFSLFYALIAKVRSYKIMMNMH